MYRIKQFFWALLSYFKKIDDNFINNYLNKEEKEIFYKLSKNEQYHSIRVCESAFDIVNDKEYDIDKKKLAKVALLHDIGKINYTLNVFEKSAIVLLDKFTKGNIKKYDNIKQINVYYNHPKMGADILKKYKSFDEEMINIVKYHHMLDNNLENKLLDIIVESDNKN